jgi:hypothetical protein
MQFKKNDPRINRNGRPKKGQSLSDILNWALDQKQKNKAGKEMLLRHALAEKLIKKAFDGDTTAIKYIYDRIDGKPRESVDISGSMVNLVASITPEERDKRLNELLGKCKT